MIFFVMRAGTAQEVTNAYARVSEAEERLSAAIRAMERLGDQRTPLKGHEWIAAMASLEDAHRELWQFVRDLRQRAA